MPETNLLSEREQEILQLVATGLTNREIAQSLTISPNTVKVHLRNIFDKINVSSRTEATMYGIEHGIIDVPGSEGNLTQPGSLNMVQRSPWALMGIVLALVVFVAVGGNLLFPPATPTPNALPAVPDRWQELAPMPEPRAGMAAATYDGNIYAIAGEGLEGVSGSVFRYLTAEDRWEQLSEKPTPVTDVEGVLIGEKIYVPGGRLAGGENTDVLDVYDPRRDTWEQKAPLPIKISGYALAEFEGQIFLFGGTDGEKVMDVALRYDPQEDAWEYMTPMPTARAYAGAAEAGGKIYVIGGWDGEKALAANEIYNPIRDIEGEEPWDSNISLSSAQYGIDANQVLEIIYISNGLNNEGNITSLYLFNTNIDEWVEIVTPEGFSPRYFSSQCQLGDSIYLIGGRLDNQISSSNYQFKVVYNLMIPISENQ